MRPFSSRPSFNFTRALQLGLLANLPAFSLSFSNFTASADACCPARAGTGAAVGSSTDASASDKHLLNIDCLRESECGTAHGSRKQLARPVRSRPCEPTADATAAGD